MFRVVMSVTSLSGREVEVGRRDPERLQGLSTVTGDLGLLIY